MLHFNVLDVNVLHEVLRFIAAHPQPLIFGEWCEQWRREVH